MRPTSTSLNPTFSTRAVLSTGTLTMTEYPTRPIKRAIEIERHVSNGFEAPPSAVEVSVINPPDMAGRAPGPAITNEYKLKAIQIGTKM